MYYIVLGFGCGLGAYDIGTMVILIVLYAILGGD